MTNCLTLVVDATVQVTNLVVTFDNLNTPYTRTVTATGTGTGTYQVKEGNTVIATRQIVNGYDMFDVSNIPLGSHTYCATPGNACDTFIVGEPLPDNKWGCADGCAAGHKVGDYNSQAECQAACSPQPQGFTIKASVISGWSTYTTKVTISKPDSILNKVNLVMAAPLIGYSCLLADIPLDPITKTAVVELQVTESMTIMATSGIGCCSLYEPLTCESSNTLALKVGVDWVTLGLFGAGVLLAFAYLSGRNKGGGTTVITSARKYDIRRRRRR